MDLTVTYCEVGKWMEVTWDEVQWRYKIQTVTFKFLSEQLKLANK